MCLAYLLSKADSDSMMVFSTNDSLATTLYCFSIRSRTANTVEKTTPALSRNWTSSALLLMYPNVACMLYPMYLHG